MERNDIETLRHNFWDQLLKKSNKKIKLFSGVKTINSVTKQCFLSTGAGSDGALYQYVILAKKPQARVQLSFESKNREKNKELFTKLFLNKDKIEFELGPEFSKDLEWLVLKNKISSRIQKIVVNRGLYDENWNEIQTKMVEDMYKLSSVLKRWS